MSRFIRSIALKLLPLSLLAIAGLAPAVSAAAGDPCENLLSSYLELHANGYIINNIGIDEGFAYTVDSIGTYKLSAAVNSDTFVGTCKDRHILFTRTRPGVFVQQYEGWIFEAGGSDEMAGVFSYNGVKKYGWYASMKPAIGIPE
jgi:hypothetical protein